jgi:hypothetical protein
MLILMVLYTLMFASSAPGARAPESHLLMKSTSNKQARDELRDEYALDSAKSKSHRFAAKLRGTTVAVLQPDVAEVFQLSKAVNDLLCSAIATTRVSSSKQHQKKRAV